MPLPLAMMIPFMGIQSAVMAKQFGENFQYGKRRISAMSNEEFNKLTPAKLQANANAELKSMIPSMEQSVIEMREFQTFLIREFLQMLNDAIGAGLGKLFGFNEDEAIKALKEFGSGPVGTTTTGTGRRATTRQVFAGERFERTLEQAQADTSRSRGTGVLTTPIVRRKAGQTQKNEKARLLVGVNKFIKLEEYWFNLRNKSTTALSKAADAKRNRLVWQKALTSLLNRYTF